TPGRRIGGGNQPPRANHEPGGVSCAGRPCRGGHLDRRKGRLATSRPVGTTVHIAARGGRGAAGGAAPRTHSVGTRSGGIPHPHQVARRCVPRSHQGARAMSSPAVVADKVVPVADDQSPPGESRWLRRIDESLSRWGDYLNPILVKETR